MKYLLIALCLACFTTSQENPQKGVNVIYISASVSNEELYKKAGQILLEDGFTISKSDKDFLQIQTNAKKIKGSNAYPRLVISVSDGKVKVVGFFGTSLDDDPTKETTRITYRGMKGSPFMASFFVMNEYATHLAREINGSIVYTEN